MSELKPFTRREIIWEWFFFNYKYGDEPGKSSLYSILVQLRRWGLPQWVCERVVWFMIDWVREDEYLLRTEPTAFWRMFHFDGSTSHELIGRSEFLPCEGRAWHENGRARHIKVKDGVSKEWDEDGNLLWSMPQTRGQMHGTLYRYFSDGQLHFKQQFCNGKKHGYSIYYDENGGEREELWSRGRRLL